MIKDVQVGGESVRTSSYDCLYISGRGIYEDFAFGCKRANRRASSPYPFLSSRYISPRICVIQQNISLERIFFKVFPRRSRSLSLVRYLPMTHSMAYASSVWFFFSADFGAVEIVSSGQYTPKCDRIGAYRTVSLRRVSHLKSSGGNRYAMRTTETIPTTVTSPSERIAGVLQPEECRCR